jgi:hypothetical protein
MKKISSSLQNQEEGGGQQQPSTQQHHQIAITLVGDAYRNFSEAIRSRETKYQYDFALKNT